MKENEGLVNDYYERLLKTKTPNLVLASAFRDIFNRDLQKKDWPSLGKVINLYGKWTVLEAFIKAGINPSFDNTTPWGYINTICLNISKDSKENLEELEKVRQIKEKTQSLINELEKPHKPIKPRKRDYLNEG